MLVHNRCNSNIFASSREEALDIGRRFLGEGYTKVETGRYVSKDGFRQMRFDFTHHNKTTHHINLETYRNELKPGVRNKIISDIHVFW